jgi:hypothetical protein
MCSHRRNLLEFLEAQFGITAPPSPLSEVQATTFLRIVFHRETTPRTAQFVYRIHCTWFGKGCSDPVDVLPDDLLLLAEDIY